MARAVVVGDFLAKVLLWMGIVKDKKLPVRWLAGACRGGEEYDLPSKHFLLGCQRPPAPSNLRGGVVTINDFDELSMIKSLWASVVWAG